MNNRKIIILDLIEIGLIAALYVMRYLAGEELFKHMIGGKRMNGYENTVPDKGEELKKLSRIAAAIRLFTITGGIGAILFFYGIHMPENIILQILIELATLVSTATTVAGIIFCASNVRYYMEHRVDGMYLIEYTIIIFIVACVLGAGIALHM